MPEWVLSVIAIVVVAGIFMIVVQKKKNDQWSGELVKKRYYPGDMESGEQWKLVFKTNEGKKKRFQVNKKVYEEWSEGDKAIKNKGEMLPVKA